MNLDWQNLTALLMVAAAGAYLARLAWLSMVRRKAAGCGSCDSCPSATEANRPRLFEIEPAPHKDSLASNGKLGSKALGR